MTDGTLNTESWNYVCRSWINLQQDGWSNFDLIMATNELLKSDRWSSLWTSYTCLYFSVKSTPKTMAIVRICNRFSRKKYTKHILSLGLIHSVSMFVRSVCNSQGHSKRKDTHVKIVLRFGLHFSSHVYIILIIFALL